MVKIVHINYPLIAKGHTPMYLMHKFWARKPHNVVAEYIKRYSKEGDVVLDPFVGSGVTAVEAIKSGRKAIGIDLNPIATFITRMTAIPIGIEELEDAFKQIEMEAKKKIVGFYETECPECGKKINMICAIWEMDKKTPTELRFYCSYCKKRSKKRPAPKDIEKIEEIEKMEIPYWYPKVKLRYPDSREFKEGTHMEGVDSISELFTRRNLIALSILHNEIESLENGVVKDLMRFTFTSMTHLASKLTPVRPTRPYSSFWPVHRYWIPPVFMESNVWMLFESAFRGRQGILKGKRDSNKQIKLYKETDDFDRLLEKDANIAISTQTAFDLSDIPGNSIDYVFTDPPYGGSIQYFELSTLWCSWLRLDTNWFKDEITINEQQDKDFDYYHKMLHAAFREIYRVLRIGRYMTVTFHSTDIKTYNSIIRVAVFAGFNLEKIVYQPPARASAKGLLQPFGSAVGDYYIRFRKPKKARKASAGVEIDKTRFEKVVVEIAKKIIAQRGEPTAYTHILNGIYPELDKYGVLLSAEEDIREIIKRHVKKEFVLVDITNEKGKKIGRKWWLKDPASVRIDIIPLNERVEKAVINVLNRKIKASFDDILQEIFVTFPNALTPETESVKNILSEYAEKTRDGKWRLRTSVRIRQSEHDDMVKLLVDLGRKAGFAVYADLPEFRGKKLRLEGLLRNQLKRVAEIDALWYKDGRIMYEFEVENTTGITEAIVRGSNIPSLETKRFIVIPEERRNILARKIKEPVLDENIEKYGWRFIFYDKLKAFYEESGDKKIVNANEVEKLAQTPKIKKEDQTTLDSAIKGIREK